MYYCHRGDGNGGVRQVVVVVGSCCTSHSYVPFYNINQHYSCCFNVEGVFCFHGY